MISVVCITNRIGGLDVLFDSLAAQTEKDFELILVDSLHAWRGPRVGKWALGRFNGVMPGYVGEEQAEANSRKFFSLSCVPPRDNPFPKQSFCRSQNTGIAHARGETVVLICDYSWLHPKCLETHAEMQRKHRGPVTLDYNYAHLPALKPGVPNYREKPPGDSPDYMPAVNENTERYAADLASGKLDPFMWSIFAEPPNEESVLALPIEHRHRPSGADLTNDWNWCSCKNESFPTELLLALNGFDEEYDRSHCYQDSELSYRLRVRGIRWHAGPPETGMLTVVNPRGIMNIKLLGHGIAYNKELCFGSRRAERLLPVNPHLNLRNWHRETTS